MQKAKIYMQKMLHFFNAKSDFGVQRVEADPKKHAAWCEVTKVRVGNTSNKGRIWGREAAAAAAAVSS
jgi:hypothetical protein